MQKVPRVPNAGTKRPATRSERRETVLSELVGGDGASDSLARPAGSLPTYRWFVAKALALAPIAVKSRSIPEPEASVGFGRLALFQPEKDFDCVTRIEVGNRGAAKELYEAGCIRERCEP